MHIFTLKKNLKKKRIFASLLLTAVALVLLAGCSEESVKTSYVMTPVERGDIENTVSSSGTLEAVGTIEVLSQMSGTVEAVYADYNDTVTKGMRLIDLNTEILEIQVKEARASVKQAQATYDHTLLDYNNNQALYKKSLLSDFDLDTSKTELSIAEAQLTSAQAKLEELEIELNQYALILSPIAGIVLERNVDTGDTVVSGSSATSLFTLAKDLSQMEIHASVDELDISEISEGQGVRFTVDAYPDDTFSGSVRQVRLLPTSTESLVTYTVIVDAENRDNKLLPGMTATIDFLVEQKSDVLMVPNAALRFEPLEMTAETDEGDEDSLGGLLTGNLGGPSGGGPAGGGQGPPSGGAPGAGGPGGPGGGTSGGSSAAGSSGATAADTMKTLWYIDDDGELASIKVQAGVSDGVHTEIIGPDDLEGMQVIEKLEVVE